MACGLPAAASALGRSSFVDSSPSPDAVHLAAGGLAAPILVDARDYAGVRRAAGDLQEDINRVTGLRPRLLTDAPPTEADVIVAGTLGQNRVIDDLVARRQLDVAEIRGRWESWIVQVVPRPWPGTARALVIAGSDKRGTIFGIYELSEQAGVSPWYWWADVPVRHRPQLFVRAGRYVQGEPAVKYRGIFINDEAPALSGWARATFGGFNHQFYARVFELLLRLRANLLWPAMWGSAFADDDVRNPALADEYGIVVGTSHHEPMMRAHDEWRRYGRGPWDYATNADALGSFWAEGLRRTAGFERIVTIGMRGDGDLPMSENADVDLLERIVADQRRIIARETGRDAATVPQVWALYKEVQEYYERGMRVPDDVTLLWSDDNWGNLRRLPTPEERRRSGGSGIYYHFDYVGGPRSYKWLNTVPIPKVWEQMHLAWRYGATRLWMVNVGDIKPMELPIQFFLDYARDPERWPAERLPDYTRDWAEREFGPEHAAEIAGLVTDYTRYNGRRKPEMLEPRTYSLVNYREAETVVAGWERLARKAEAIAGALPREARDAFFELVLYPIKACGVVNDLYVTAGRNHLYAVQGRTLANALADRVRELFDLDAQLTRTYNGAIAGGKWTHMMDQTHLGYTSWNEPVRNAMPAVQTIQPSQPGEMGVAIEGSEGSWPGGTAAAPVLPALSASDRTPRYIEIFNRGREPFEFVASASQPWLQVDVPRGSVTGERRIWVSARFDAAPTGTTSANVVIAGPGGAQVVVGVPVVNPPAPPASLDAFLEANSYVSIEAEHYTRALSPEGRRWVTIPGFGRTLSGVMPSPVTASFGDGGEMCLEYRMLLTTAGRVRVHAYLAPTQAFRPGPGLRYGVSFDDEPMQTIDVHGDRSLQAWERAVGDGVAILISTHALTQPGVHVLKFRALDPGVVLEKLVVDTGGLRPSYLGPPESARAGPPAR